VVGKDALFRRKSGGEVEAYLDPFFKSIVLGDDFGCHQNPAFHRLSR